MAKIYELFKKYIDPNISLNKFKKKINSSDNGEVYEYLDKIPEYKNNPIYSIFTPIDILFEYEEKPIQKFNYYITDTITLSIHSCETPNDDFIKKVIFRIMLLKPKEFNNKLDIVMFLSKHKKTIDFKSKEPLGINEVNSGVSTIYYNGNNQTIAIFREEECLKVLIHELLHAFNMDDKDYRNTKIEDKVDSVKGSLELNEAYVEFTACVYNSICIILERNNYSFNKDTFQKMMKNEISHGIKQVAKILKYYNYKNINEYIEPKKKQFKLKEDTHVAAYYIFKLFILDNYKKYMNMPIKFILDDPELLVNPSLKRRINYRLKQHIGEDQVSLKMCYY